MVAPHLRYPKTLGGLVHQLELSKALAKRGHEVHLITQNIGPHQKDVDLENVQIHEIKLVPLPLVADQIVLLLKTFILILKLNQKYNFSVIHDRGYLLGGAGTIAATLLRKPVVLQVDDNWFESARYHGKDFPSFFRFLYLILGMTVAKDWLQFVILPNVQRIVAVSRVLEDVICEEWHYPRSKVSVVPNGVNLTRFRPSEAGNELKRQLKLEKKRVVVFVGEIAPWQGVECLLRAVAKAVDQFPSIMALIVGGVSRAHADYLKQLKSLTNSLGISDHVVFTGVMPPDKIPNIVASAEITVAPFVSSKSGRLVFSPLKIFEYMAAEKAIIASKVPWIEEILEHNKTALLVNPGSAEDLSDALITLFSNSDMTQSLGRNARLVAENKYGWDKIAIKIEEAYETLFKETGKTWKHNNLVGQGS